MTNVVLATGGFASDLNDASSLIKQFRPDLLKYRTTNGPFATGDGSVIICHVMLLLLCRIQPVFRRTWLCLRIFILGR